MIFAQRLERAAQSTEARLSRLLDELVPPCGADVASERLAAAVRHATLGGGKRVRPFLVLESAALFGLPKEAALDAAAAVECIHCYSLAHDDLPAMDNDELRRGRPTVWKAYDEWTAILAGDALLTAAFEIAAAPATHADPSVRAELAAGLARAAGARGMVGGQALDLEAEKLRSAVAPTHEHVRRLQSLKTGALIAFACEAGAIVAKAEPAARAALRRYGEALGSAFQIADDLLDAEGDTAIVGKRVSKDAAAGKATLVGVLGLEPARKALAGAEADALDALSGFGAEADVLREAVTFVARRQL